MEDGRVVAIREGSSVTLEVAAREPAARRAGAMKVYILTLFPEVFGPILQSSILKRAKEAGLLQVKTVNIRDFAIDKHGTVDDYPYGGGPGMVLKPEPVYEALAWVRRDSGTKPYVALMTPQGRKFATQVARDLAKRDPLVLVAGSLRGV